MLARLFPLLADYFSARAAHDNNNILDNERNMEKTVKNSSFIIYKRCSRNDYRIAFKFELIQYTFAIVLFEFCLRHISSGNSLTTHFSHSRTCSTVKMKHC
jgi:hypothetical protein